MSKIRREGSFKTMELPKHTEEHKKPKFNLVCIGNTKDSKNRVVVSEKAQPEHTWSTTTLKSAPIEVQKKIKVITSDQPRQPAKSFPTKHKTLLCPSCNAMNNNMQTHGYQWLCNSCHTERLITPSLNADIYAHIGPRHYICSGVMWQCFKCRKTQIDLLQ